MDGQALAKVFEFSHMALTRNLEGITHEESVRPPDEGGNSLNWVLGHLLYYRNTVLKMLGQPPAWDSPRAERYARGSAPLGPDDDPVPFETLRAELDRSQGLLVAALRSASPEQLAAPTERANLWLPASPCSPSTRAITAARSACCAGCWATRARSPEELRTCTEILEDPIARPGPRLIRRTGLGRGPRGQVPCAAETRTQGTAGI
jgi:hypothetical protein